MILDAESALPSGPLASHHSDLSLLPKYPGSRKRSTKARAQEYRASAREVVFGRHQQGASGLSVCRLLTAVDDRLLQGLFEELASARLSKMVSLIALGGFGRRELAPFSDLDLLVLCPSRSLADSVKGWAQQFHTLLWDLRLHVGWSLRTPSEAARAAADDPTFRTALLDSRWLAGSERLCRELTDHNVKDLLNKRGDEFIAVKVAELRSRREKYGDSIYVLEPNIKVGEGGLRDLEAALWIAQARFRVRGLSEILQRSILPPSEVNALRNARDFMLRIRNQSHFSKGRKEDRLTFELQEEIAQFLGHENSVEGLAVERFMRHYYLAAKVIRRAADGLIARCEEEGRSRDFGPERRLGQFKVFRGKVTLQGDPSVLSHDPTAILRLFRAADELDLPLNSWAQAQVRQAVSVLAKNRGDPGVVNEFKSMLLRPGTSGRFLWEMHELGVLGALLPEFGRITAHHQHDLYHVYTVDVHSLFAMRRLYALRNGELTVEQPELTREMTALADPLPLYLGTMFHDAGKGLGGNHSEKGRQLMAAVGERLRLDPRQREVSEFLVQEHLLMSRIAQRRDLTDPELIADFSRTVGDLEKLTTLYLLTYADISSVGPNMWTEWKAQLLRDLFYKARGYLLGTPSAEPRQVMGLRSAFIERWATSVGVTRAAEVAKSLPDRYFESTPVREALRHAKLLTRAMRETLAATLNHQRSAGFSKLCLAVSDRPGLLATLTGVLSAHRVNILSAGIISTSEGLALDTFDLQGPRGRFLERRRWTAAKADLRRVLTGEVDLEEVLRINQSGTLLRRHLPSVPTQISFDNRASQNFTILDVRAADRIGLLHVIASSLHLLNVEIALARISTEANRAIDSFYVSRAGAKIVDPVQLQGLVQSVEQAIAAFARG